MSTLNMLQSTHQSIISSSDGVFGAMMQVHIQNDGPVTIPLEAPDNLPVSKTTFLYKTFHLDCQ